MFIYDQFGLAPVARKMFVLQAFKFKVFQRPTKPYTASTNQTECHLANWRSVSKPCSAIQAAEQLEEALTNSRPGLVQFSQYSVVLLNLCHDTINLTGVLDTHS